MEIAIYKTHGTIELLPAVTVCKVNCKGRVAYAVVAAWLVWALDVQWETEEKI